MQEGDIHRKGIGEHLVAGQDITVQQHFCVISRESKEDVQQEKVLKEDE